MNKNIKQKVIAVACLLVAVFTATGAHAASLHIGPCEGKTTTTGIGKTGSGTVSAAIVIPAEQLKQYSGARIKGMRFWLVTTDGMSNVSGWVRNGIYGNDLCSEPVSTPSASWNEVSFASTPIVTGEDSLAVGFSFDQQSTVKCFSIAGNSDANGYWVGKDGNWNNKSGSVNGSLSVEIIIEGDNIAGKNLCLQLVSSDRTTRWGETFNAICTVKNTAEAAINGYSYTCKIDGQTVKEGTANKLLTFHSTDTIRLAIASDVVAKGVKIPVTMEITSEGDEIDSDNAMAFTMSTYDDTNKTFFRKTLLEEFSTEECPNCERGIKTIEQCMKQGYDKSTVQITHHAGYKPDFLTTADGKKLEWFYGNDGTYAPAVMLDRLSDPDVRQVLSGKAATPVMNIGYADTFAPVLAYMTSRPAYVSVTPSVAYDTTSRTLDITVNIEKDEILDALADSARLTVYITQDSILHHHQAGYSSTTFRHRHVYRASVSSLWGDKIVWNGNTATMHYTYRLPETVESMYPDEGYDSTVPVEPRDIAVVTFVSDYNANDRCACTVFNANDYALKDEGTSDVIAVKDSKSASISYFTTAGTAIEHPINGIYLMRTTYSDGTVKTIKIAQ